MPTQKSWVHIPPSAMYFSSAYFCFCVLLLKLIRHICRVLQVYTTKSSRRDSRAHASPERRHSRDQHSPVRFPRLRRQSTAIDESCLPPGVWGEGEGGRQARRDSLSPDSASYQRAAGQGQGQPQGQSQGQGARRDSRSHLSPDRAGGGSRDVSPVSPASCTPTVCPTPTVRSHSVSRVTEDFCF